jgi:hypothetical protein
MYVKVEGEEKTLAHSKFNTNKGKTNKTRTKTPRKAFLGECSQQ